MIKLSLFLMLTAMTPAAARLPEDEAHRIDRLETKRLNELANRHATSHPIQSIASPATPRVLTPAEQTLEAREEKAIAAWRRGGAACPSSTADAC